VSLTIRGHSNANPIPSLTKLPTINCPFGGLDLAEHSRRLSTAHARSGHWHAHRVIFPLASGFVRARTLSMKSSLARLRDRFVRVMIATLSRLLGNSTGKTLSDGFLRGSRTQ
jgi:hypothetical protein